MADIVHIPSGSGARAGEAIEAVWNAQTALERRCRARAVSTAALAIFSVPLAIQLAPAAGARPSTRLLLTGWVIACALLVLSAALEVRARVHFQRVLREAGGRRLRQPEEP